MLYSKEKPKELSDSEFEVRFHRSTGKGGQRKNKVATCCEITHIPTGMTQKADGRSRIDNEEEAMTKIRARLLGIASREIADKINGDRVSQISDASFRQYRFQDDLVIDQRTGKRVSLKSFMRGKMDLIW